MDETKSALSSQGEASAKSAPNPFEEGRGEAWTDDVSKFAPWQLELFRKQQQEARQQLVLFQEQQEKALRQ